MTLPHKFGQATAVFNLQIRNHFPFQFHTISGSWKIWKQSVDLEAIASSSDIKLEDCEILLGFEKARIWTYFTQCCSGVFIAEVEQVVTTREVVLTFCGCWLLPNLEKRKKSKNFNRLQIEVFFLPNIIPPVYKPIPQEYRPIKFVLCLYICPGSINGILW